MNLKEFNSLVDLFFSQEKKQSPKNIFLEWLNPKDRKRFSWEETSSNIYKLAKILRENIGSVSDMWEVVLEAFLKSGQGEKEAIRNARMARILRHGEFNTDTNIITLWTPEGKAETFDASPIEEKVLVHEPNLWRTP